MSTGLYAFLSQHSLELYWRRSLFPGWGKLVTASVPVDDALDADEGVKQAFLRAVSTLGCPTQLPVTWVVPPDVAGVITTQVSGAVNGRPPPLPFTDSDVRQVGLSESDGILTTLWVHINWVGILEDACRNAGQLPVQLISRAQALSSCVAQSAPASVAWLLEKQGDDAYLHAFDVRGDILRSVALAEGTAQITQEVECLSQWIQIPVEQMSLPAAEPAELASDCRIQQLLRWKGGQLPAVALSDRLSYMQRLWRRYVIGHGVIAIVLAAAAAATMGLQDHTLAQLQDRVGPLREESQVVQGARKDERRLKEANDVIASAQQRQDARVPLAELVGILPSNAYIVRVGADPEKIEIDLQFSDTSLNPENFAFHVDGYGTPEYTDAGAGIGKYILRAQEPSQARSLSGNH